MVKCAMAGPNTLYGLGLHEPGHSNYDKRGADPGYYGHQELNGYGEHLYHHDHTHDHVHGHGHVHNHGHPHHDGHGYGHNHY